MLKITFLRNMLLLSLLLVTLLPLYDLFYIYPAYRQLLTEETEDEAVRFVNYLVRTLHLDEQPLSAERLPADFDHETDTLMGDALLIKLRVFSPAGEIIYSTVSTEIGSVNKNPYFHQIVARGRVYSKVVKKDRLTAEGQRLAMDVVETYVPVMVANGFGGAMEVYYDITESRSRIEQLTRRSSVVLIGICFSMLLIVLGLLAKAKRFWLDRQQAEDELKQSHETLEGRVRERTGQLLQANQKLTEEIAERTLAQMALKSALSEAEAAREKIDGILSSVSDGLLVVDEQQRVLLMNRPAEDALGISFSTVSDRSLVEALPESELSQQLRDRLVLSTDSAVFDFRQSDPQTEDSERTFQGRCSPLLNRDGQVVGQIVLMQDVSREREIERLKSEFLAMAAHELHTPITTIMGYTELLASQQQEEFSDEQRREFTGYIHNKAMALAHMVDDLLDVSRVAAGKTMQLQYSRFSMAELVEASTRSLPLTAAHRMTVEVDPADLEWTADRFRLEQLFGNLLGNAVKYSPDGGEISLVASLERGLLKVVISDQGIGMNEQAVAHVFERFYRADNSTTAVAGTGLGMSVSKIIVEAHDGDIHLESQEGVGTTVTFTLPRGALGD